MKVTHRFVRIPLALLRLQHDDDDDDEILYPPVSVAHLHTCLTITEENEEELEQLRQDDEQQQQKKVNHLIKIQDHSNPMLTRRDQDDRADLLENEDPTIIPVIPLDDERLSTIYESASPPPRLEEEDDDTYDKLIVYDVAHKPVRLSSPLIDRSRIRSCFTDATFQPCSPLSSTLSASNLCGTTTMIQAKVFHPPLNKDEKKSSSSPTIHLRPSSMFPVPSSRSLADDSQHIQKMKMIQSSSSSLSDFLVPSVVHYEEVSSVHHSLTDCSLMQQIPCCAAEDEDESPNPRRPSFTRRILTNGLLLSNNRRPAPPLTFNSQQQHRYPIKPKSEEKLSTLSSPSSSPQSNSPTGEKLLMSRSDYILQQPDCLSSQRKATSLKSIRANSKILYPIDFDTKVPTSDSGIVIDTDGTRPTSDVSHPSAEKKKKMLLVLLLLLSFDRSLTAEVDDCSLERCRCSSSSN